MLQAKRMERKYEPLEDIIVVFHNPNVAFECRVRWIETGEDET